MGTLIKKELTSLLCSSTAVFFCCVFLLITGLMNWFFPGSFNIPDNGYANMNSFFRMASVLLVILTPALTMRSFSEEIKSKNLDITRIRPIALSSYFFSKVLASSIVILLTFSATTIYVYTLYNLSIPVGNIDLNEIAASYASLFLISIVFIVIGLFSSSLTKNQVVAFIIGIFFNFIVFYGFNLLASLFTTGSTQLTVSSFGLSSHYDLMQKGVIRLKDILTVFNYIFCFSVISIFILNLKNKRTKNHFAIRIFAIVILNIIFLFLPNARFDFTSDQRYTISDYSKNMLSGLSDTNDIQVNVYLNGDLNPGFQHLQNAIKDILSDFSGYANGHIQATFINPHHIGNQQQVFEAMDKMGMKGIVLNEVDREGKASRKVIYPYALVISGQDTLPVNLLKNVGGYSAEENLNASIENLEFGFIDAIRLLNKSEADEIAFIDGHDEIPRAYVYDAEELLSKYFFVNRGQITDDISVLNNFKVVIIAGSKSKFTEQEKYILDQYIMSGGRVLWLIDGVYLSHEDLTQKGESASMKNDTNLDDMLFTYGVRINPVLLQDTQCSTIMLADGNGDNSSYITMPWYYSPLLLPTIEHPVTKDISLIKAQFASSLDITDKSGAISKTILLTTSAHTHVVKVPETISLDLSGIPNNAGYFDQGFLPVAVALNGTFSSAFTNRMIPEGLPASNIEQKTTSKPTKMIVASASDIIRNELIGQNNETQVLPMGYDKASERQYGNRDFIVNAVNWLANDDDWLALRSKQQQIRLLNKQLIYSERNSYTLMNTSIPLIFILTVIGSVYFYRKYKYER